MKEKISRNKISRHYKSFFGLENMGLGENDNLMIDWGESLVNDFCNQEVEKRIAEKYFPTEEKLSNNSLYNQLQQSSQDNLLSDLTALISENYVEKAKYDELLRQRDELREALEQIREIGRKHLGPFNTVSEITMYELARISLNSIENEK